MKYWTKNKAARFSEQHSNEKIWWRLYIWSGWWHIIAHIKIQYFKRVYGYSRYSSMTTWLLVLTTSIYKLLRNKSWRCHEWDTEEGSTNENVRNPGRSHYVKCGINYALSLTGDRYIIALNQPVRKKSLNELSYNSDVFRYYRQLLNSYDMNQIAKTDSVSVSIKRTWTKHYFVLESLSKYTLSTRGESRAGFKRGEQSIRKYLW